MSQIIWNSNIDNFTSSQVNSEMKNDASVFDKLCDPCLTQAVENYEHDCTQLGLKTKRPRQLQATIPQTRPQSVFVDISSKLDKKIIK